MLVINEGKRIDKALKATTNIVGIKITIDSGLDCFLVDIHPMKKEFIKSDFNEFFS